MGFGLGCELRALGEAHALGQLVARVLVVHAHLAHARLAHLTLGGLEVLEHQLEQRRLARAVGADERDARVLVRVRVRVRVGVRVRVRVRVGVRVRVRVS